MLEISIHIFPPYFPRLLSWIVIRTFLFCGGPRHPLNLLNVRKRPQEFSSQFETLQRAHIWLGLLPASCHGSYKGFLAPFLISGLLIGVSFYIYLAFILQICLLGILPRCKNTKFHPLTSLSIGLKEWYTVFLEKSREQKKMSPLKGRILFVGFLTKLLNIVEW